MAFINVRGSFLYYDAAKKLQIFKSTVKDKSDVRACFALTLDPTSGKTTICLTIVGSKQKDCDDLESVGQDDVCYVKHVFQLSCPEDLEKLQCKLHRILQFLSAIGRLHA